jgi:hypothetical protein
VIDSISGNYFELSSKKPFWSFFELEFRVHFRYCNCGVFKFTHHRRKASLARSLLESKMMTGKLSMKETGRGNRVEEGVGERSTN